MIILLDKTIILLSHCCTQKPKFIPEENAMVNLNPSYTSTDAPPDRGRIPDTENCDLRIIFYIRELIRNVPIVLVASDTNAIGPQACYGKIKLLDFLIYCLLILSVIDSCNSSAPCP